MGFKSASTREDLITKQINEKLKLLYSPSPSRSLWPTIRSSPVRDNEKEFNSILDKVEELLSRYDKNPHLRIGGGNFNQKFLGIVDFLYEAGDLNPIVVCIEGEEYKKETEVTQISKDIKKRFISVADKLWDYCDPIEF